MNRLNNALKQRDAAREEALSSGDKLAKLQEELESGAFVPAAQLLEAVAAARKSAAAAAPAAAHAQTMGEPRTPQGQIAQPRLQEDLGALPYAATSPDGEAAMQASGGQCACFLFCMHAASLLNFISARHERDSGALQAASICLPMSPC